MSEAWIAQQYSEVVEQSELKLGKAKKVSYLAASKRYLGATFIRACKRGDGAEAVILDVVVSLGQSAPVHKINSRESIAVLFAGDAIPSVISMRDDFPDVPHLNASAKGTPRSFCLYDQASEEIQPSWTALSFVERIRWWLFKAAYGELHGDQQPLDPILFGGSSFVLVCPSDIPELTQDKSFYVFRLNDETQTPITLRLVSGKISSDESSKAFGVVSLVARPQEHGRLRYAPQNLLELRDFDQELETDLVVGLERKLLEWVKSDQRLLSSHLLILVTIPIKRNDKDDVELHSTRAFLTTATAGEVGRALGLIDLAPDGGGWGPLVGDKTPLNLDVIGVLMGDVQYEFSSQLAARASGQALELTNTVQIGVGALGSQLALVLAQGGFGRWTFIDRDQLLPHNLSRHALPYPYVGSNKALGLEHYLTNLLSDGSLANGLATDFLEPQDQKDALEAALKRSELVVDTSASVAVSRQLARSEIRNGPAISLFFNPSGTDLVVLWEGANRKLRLDDVEIAYLAELLNRRSLVNHLKVSTPGLIHGTSCREPSIQIPQSRVVRLVGFAADALRDIVNKEDPRILLWRHVPRGIILEANIVPDLLASSESLCGWEIRCPSRAITYLLNERVFSGSIETGGVIVGAWDRQLQVIYVAGFLGAPPDSERSRYGFRRGSSGLSKALDSISATTMGQLGYVGEWHTHPSGHLANLSADDQNFMEEMKELTRLEDSPALMMVAGEDGVRCAILTPGSGEVQSTLIRNDQEARSG